MMTFGTGYLKLIAAFIFLAGAACFSGAAQACSQTTACEVRDGVYRIVLPQDRESRGKIGAIFFFHGFTGSSLETATHTELAAVAQKQGVALVAPEGLGGRWSFPGVGEPQRDEIAYVERVIEDAVRRFNLDPETLMASGFSLGGSMVWYRLPHARALRCVRANRRRVLGADPRVVRWPAAKDDAFSWAERRHCADWRPHGAFRPAARRCLQEPDPHRAGLRDLVQR